MWQMIDQESIEAYKSIKAPESLKERVLAFDQTEGKGKKNARFIRTFASIAACLVLFAGVSVTMLRNQQDQGIFLDGQQIGTTPVQVTGEENQFARLRMLDGITIQLVVKEDATLEVTEGRLQVDTKEDYLIPKESPVHVVEDTNFYWTLEEGSQGELTISNDRVVMDYEMYQDETSKQYYIKLKGTEKL